MPASSDPRERVNVLLGLALSETSTPVGSPPSNEEIAAFYDSRLKGEQFQRVKAHLAHSDSSFTQLAELIEGVEPTFTNSGRSTWWQHINACFQGWRGLVTGGGVATAATVVLVVALLLPGLPLQTEVDQAYDTVLGLTAVGEVPERWPVPQTGVHKSITKGAWQDQARTALGTGIREGLTRLVPDNAFWHRVSVDLPQTPLPCKSAKDQQACQQFTELTRSFGRWVALMQTACNLDSAGASGLETAFWTQQRELLKVFGARYWETASYGAFRLRLTDWQQTASGAETDRAALCQGVGRMVSYDAMGG